MAKTYPESTFIGYDYHADSIHTARERASAAGVKNVSFEVASAVSYPGLREVVVTGGGFGKFKRATETPFSLVLEARP